MIQSLSVVVSRTYEVAKREPSDGVQGMTRDRKGNVQPELLQAEGKTCALKIYDAVAIGAKIPKPSHHHRPRNFALCFEVKALISMLLGTSKASLNRPFADFQYFAYEYLCAVMDMCY